MNCQEVQLQLSGYLEKSLDAIRMKGIETHIASCPFCRIEARGLSDCIALVSALPALDPPSGFAQRVMAHAREYQLDIPLWQRLVAVLRTTAPIQASAVVLVGVLAVLLYQREPRFQDSSVDELSPPAAVLNSEAEVNTIAPPPKSVRDSSDRSSEPPARARAKAEPTSSSVAVDKPATQSKPTPQAPAVPSPDLPPQRMFEFSFPARRIPFQAQEISTGRESFRQSPDAFGFGASIGALNRQLYGTAPFPAGRALSPLSEPSPDFEFIVRRRGLEKREAAAEPPAGESADRRSETDSAIASAAAQRAVPAPRSTSSSIVEIRWFTVAPHHLDEFRKDLAAEANIDSEKKTVNANNDSSSRDSADPFLIKVVILPSDH
jgi:hypothetical protein